MKIDLTIDRTCKLCSVDEFDHPCFVHLLYYVDFYGKEKVYDCYEDKGKVDDMMSLLEELHGIGVVYNVYKFRYSYDECKGKF